MITAELIARINELARKRRSQGLDPEETEEQARLRRLYLDGIKEQMKGLLDSIEVADVPPDRIFSGQT